MNDAVLRCVRYFETLTPATLEDIGRFYAEDAHFSDPFNDARGLPRIKAVYAHMFDQLDHPGFVVTETIASGNAAFLAWEFRFRRRSRPALVQCIAGASRLRFNPAGLIVDHRDYWDAAGQVYERLPLLGILLRMLKKRIATP